MSDSCRTSTNCTLTKPKVSVSALHADRIPGVSETLVVDAGFGCSPATRRGGTTTDALHQNDSGLEVLAQALRRDAVNIPYRPGIW